MLAQGHNLRLRAEGGGQGRSSTQTRKPGQSAHAGATQGVFAWNRKSWEGGLDPHPQDFSLTKKTARFTKGQFRPY